MGLLRRVPSEDIDVFVFDSIFMAHLVNEGCLLPIPDEKIQDRKDILPFALSACTVDDKVYALPQLLCANVLCTRKGDSELNGVTNVAQLHEVLGDHTYEEVISSDKGLLMDLTGNTTKTLSYLQALMDYEQRYQTEFPALTGDTLSKKAEDSLLSLIAMGASWSDEGLEDAGPYHHAELFAKGAGRAYIGFSEALSAMGDYADNVDVRLISMADGHDLPVFYADFAGINAHIDEANKDAAFDLLNLITGSETMTAAIAGTAENPHPQYLLPARSSVYSALAKSYPQYDRLKELVETAGAQVMQLMPDGRSYLEQYKRVLGNEIETESTGSHS
ncbi:MAG: thiamine pyridinylase [Coriobacteriales bacterium]|nr:thiamine pyridinylase [Coriobacteriales bacterium]